MSTQKTAHRGSVGKTVLGLLVLGCSSVIFGALVLGPNLGKRLGADTPINIGTPKSSGTRKLLKQ